jgi:tRNA (guanine-N7-)-methyltransferase
MPLRGRLTTAQRRALDELLPDYAVDCSAPLLAEHVYGRNAPLGVEIGFGTGDALIHWSEQQPDWNFLGIEIYPPGIGALLTRLAANESAHVKIAQGRAEDVFGTLLGPESVAGVRILFPDPWPKKRHHKRRLIQSAFVANLVDRLQPGGLLHFATDWEPYAEWAQALFAAEPTLRQIEAEDVENLRPETRFERRGQRLGHRIIALCYVRTERSTLSS